MWVLDEDVAVLGSKYENNKSAAPTNETKQLALDGGGVPNKI